VAILVRNGVAGVLPALIAISLLASGAVFEQAVAILVSELLAPAQRRVRGRQVAFEKVAIARPPKCVPERQHVQRRRIVRPVVGRVRDVVEVGQLAAAELVDDLPRLCVGVVVRVARLRVAQRRERTSRWPRAEQARHQRSHEAVSPEERQVPGRSGGDERRIIAVIHREPLEIASAALERQLEERRTLDRDIFERRIARLLVLMRVAAEREPLAVDLGHDIDTASPRLPRFELQVEDHLRADMFDRAAGGLECDMEPAAEIPALVGERQRPVARYYAPHPEPRRNGAIMHVEDVREVGIETERELDRERLIGERGERDVIVERAERAPAHPEVHRALRDLGARHSDQRVLHVPLRCRRIDPRPCDRTPCVARDAPFIGRQHSSVACEEPVELLGVQLTIDRAGQGDTASA
jgi:hypothetical protein